MTCFYIYAIVPSRSDLPVGIRGVSDEPLARVCCDDLAAVVGEIAGAGIEVTEERVAAHHDVVSRLRRQVPAIPVRFGTLFETEEALRASIERQHDILVEDIARLEGTVEFGVTVLWGSHLDSIDLPAPSDSQSAATGTDYMRRRLAEHRREAELRRIAEDVNETVSSALMPLALDSQENVLPSDTIPLRASFLVREQDAGRFGDAFEALRERTQDLRLMLVGPWPPYSFVTPDDDVRAGTHGANTR